jgi:DNA-binding MarR family transcriptional regulator
MGDFPLVHNALTRYTGFLLSRAGFTSMKGFAEAMEPIGLTPRLWGMLNILEHERGISQQQLGASIGIDPSSIVAAVDDLEARGLAERKRDPNDRRAYALHLTELGTTTLKNGRKHAAAAQATLLQALTAEEQAELHRLLSKILGVGADDPSPKAPAKSPLERRASVADREIAGVAVIEGPAIRRP